MFFVLQQWCVGGKTCAAQGGILTGGGGAFRDFCFCLAASLRRLALVRVRWVCECRRPFVLYFVKECSDACARDSAAKKRDENQLLRAVAPPYPPHMMGAVGSVVRLLACLVYPHRPSSTDGVTQGVACAFTNDESVTRGGRDACDA